MLEELRAEVCEANLELVRRGLVLYTFGNASGVSRELGLVVIKPSGVPYASMTPADMVVTDLHGKVVEGSLRPSSDLDTHLALYRAFPTVGGMVHTHSRHATAWAQACREIPCLGTTHADYFHGPIPVALVASHGPFCWGRSAAEAAHNAAIVEELAAMAWLAMGLNPAGAPIADALRDKHYFRKHGDTATYGQRS